MFTPEQKTLIQEVVGRFCQSLSSVKSGRPKLTYRIRGNAVFILQTTPSLIRNHKPVEMLIAKIHHDQHQIGHWILFSPRGRGKWRQYPEIISPTGLEGAVLEIATDPFGIFFGRH